jgi:hypothetical protein
VQGSLSIPPWLADLCFANALANFVPPIDAIDRQITKVLHQHQIKELVGIQDRFVTFNHGFSSLGLVHI